MLRNIINIIIRSLFTHKLYSLINIIGLAVGMATALLISIYVLHEFSFDKFHKDSGNIYRVTVEGKLKGKDLNIALTSIPMAKTLVKEFPEVESSTRIARFGAWLVSNDTIQLNEDNFLFADANFFNFFSFKLLKGNPDSVLAKPRSVVLTKTMAEKYFGLDDPVGRKLMIETDSNLYTVTGIAEDVPPNSHFHFEMIGALMTFEKFLPDLWVSHNVYTYFKTSSKSDINVLNAKIDSLVGKYLAPQAEEYLGISLEYFLKESHTFHYPLQPLERIHLHSGLDIELERNGSAVTVYTFGIIALLILIIACLNYINLSTAYTAKRVNEIALIKIVGSETRSFYMQFIAESIIFSFIALIIAFFMAELAIPTFNEFLNIHLQFSEINNYTSISLIVTLTVVIGIILGIYPAYYISLYDPLKIMKGKAFGSNFNKRIREGFVGFQFFISILLIILTFIVVAQVDFMLNKELGFAKDRILVIRRSDALKDQIDNFKKEILRNPNIESATNSNSIPGRNFLISTSMLEGSKVNFLMNQIYVKSDFGETFGLRMDQGRFFTTSIASDSIGCVINETAASILKTDSILGRYLIMPGKMKKEGKRFKILGIVKDFHFETVDKEIEPLVILPMPGNWEGYLDVRLNSQNIDKSIKYLEQTWNKYTQDFPFVYFFLDEDYDNNYHLVIGTGKVLFILAILVLILSSIGLYGLVLYNSDKKAKEIAIRKAMGAAPYRIMILLFGNTFKLVVVATFFSWSAAYLFSKLWLSEFYSRITISLKYFIFSSLILLIISILVEFIDYYRASRRNPVELFKAE